MAETIPANPSEKEIELLFRKGMHASAIGMGDPRNENGHSWRPMAYDPKLVGNVETGVLHGGAITALLDHTGGDAVQSALGRRQPIATLDLRLDYMRPASPGLGVMAHAHCFKLTKHIAFVRGTAYQEDEADPVATCVATYILAPNQPAPIPANLPEMDDSDIPRPAEVKGAAAFLETIPYARFLNIVVDQKGNEITTILPFRRRLVGNPFLPALHGGAIGAFLETTAITQLGFDTGDWAVPKPICITIEYLRSGRPVETYGRAVVTRQGRRVATVRVEAWQEDRRRPIAAAQGHFLLREAAAATD
ncbi:PaaI family thioesterase [Zavarzinia sp. CC-PAN008]|uniref:PaaI family thioesterase n=1 Tax=Zavarzinia sp. CC-PAN008 TaxID=3243332 RepID=UPI003F7472E3